MKTKNNLALMFKDELYEVKEEIWQKCMRARQKICPLKIINNLMNEPCEKAIFSNKEKVEDKCDIYFSNDITMLLKKLRHENQ